MMRKVAAIALAVVSDALRRKVLWAVFVFGALMAIAIPSLPSYGTGVDAAVFRDFAIALTFTASLLVTIALSVVRVPTEVERRTVFTILGRDVARWQYLVGTWVGIFLVMIGVQIAFLGVTVGIGWATYGQPAFQLAEASFAILLECGVVAAFCLMVTTRLGAVTGVVAALAFLFIGHSLAGLVTGGAEGAAAPWWLPSLDVFNVINPVAHGSGISIAYGGMMVVAFALWCGVLLLGAAALFQGRDL